MCLYLINDIRYQSYISGLVTLYKLTINVYMCYQNESIQGDNVQRQFPHMAVLTAADVLQYMVWFLFHVYLATGPSMYTPGPVYMLCGKQNALFVLGTF